MSKLSLLASFLLLLSVGIAGCGGDDDGDGGNGNGGAIDASADTPDASQDSADADVGTSSALGRTCTGAPEQGDCPDGFVCLPLQSGSWCSKVCGSLSPTPSQDDAVCTDGYDGPGAARCLLTIQVQGGGDPDNNIYCGIACQDDTEGGQVCGNATCDGTCPHDLTCDGPIVDQNQNQIGESCS